MVRPICPQLRKCRVRPGSYARCHASPKPPAIDPLQPFAVLGLHLATCGSAASSPMHLPRQEDRAMSRPRTLENIRVVDFSWVRAGPWATRWLGALGAEVIKIEWPENERGRLPRTTTPHNLEVNLNTSGNFNDTNV